MIAPASRTPPTAAGQPYLAPAELSAFQVEPHAGATERAHAVHAVDPFGVRRGARLANEPRQRFPIT